jgi:hypothetical protein
MKNKGKQNPSCPCPYDCERNNNCEKCQEYHHKRNEKTFCEK